MMKYVRRTGVMFAAILPLIGCAHSSPETKPLELLHSKQFLTPQSVTQTNSDAIQQVQAVEEVRSSWSLDQLLEKAQLANPELAAARAKVDVACGQLVQAGLYPNPTVGWRSEEMSLNKAGGGQQGPYLNQEIVTGGKLAIAQAAARHGVQAADWQAVTKWFEIATSIRIAYYELLAAERELAVNREIVTLAAESVKKADTLQLDGSVLGFDVKKAQVELSLSQGKVAVSERQIEAGKRKLAALVGIPRQSIAVIEGAWTECSANYQWEVLLATAFTKSSEIQEAQALIQQSCEQLRLAEVQPIPNLQIQVRPAYDIPDRSAMLFVEGGIAWPVFNKNQGNIMSARAEVARAEAFLKQTESRLAEKLSDTLGRFKIAEQRCAMLGKAKTDADESLRLVQSGNFGDRRVARFMDVLDAQRLVSQIRLDLLTAQTEMWKAKCEIDGILQTAGTSPGWSGKNATSLVPSTSEGIIQ